MTEIERLEWQLKREREMGLANHWSYSLPRHEALLKDHEVLTGQKQTPRKFAIEFNPVSRQWVTVWLDA